MLEGRAKTQEENWDSLKKRVEEAREQGFLETKSNCWCGWHLAIVNSERCVTLDFQEFLTRKQSWVDAKSLVIMVFIAV